MRYIIVLLLFFLIFCCDTKTLKKGNYLGIDRNIVSHKYSSANNSNVVEVKFPDTVFRNKLYNLDIIYRGRLDSITQKVLDSVYPRYLEVNYFIDSLPKKEFSERKLDTLMPLSTRDIRVEEIKFIKLGVNYLNVLINDFVFLPIDSKKSRMINNKNLIFQKVIVVDSLNPASPDGTDL